MGATDSKHRRAKRLPASITTFRTQVFGIASCAATGLSLFVSGCSEVVGVGDLQNTHGWVAAGSSSSSSAPSDSRLSTSAAAGASASTYHEVSGGVGGTARLDEETAAAMGGIPSSTRVTAGDGGSSTDQAVGTSAGTGGATHALDANGGQRVDATSTLSSGGSAGAAGDSGIYAGGYGGAAGDSGIYAGGYGGAAGDSGTYAGGYGGAATTSPNSGDGGLAEPGQGLLTFDLERDLLNQTLGTNDSISWIPSGGLRVPFLYSSPFLGLQSVYALPWLLRNQEVCTDCSDVVEWVTSNEGNPHPVVVLNTSPTTNLIAKIPVPGSSVSLSPGPQGQYAAILWSSPLKGAAQIEAKFTGLSLATTDVHVFSPGKWVYSSEIFENGDISTFLLSTAIEENQVVVFAVGYGSNLHYYSDTTQLQVRIALAF